MSLNIAKYWNLHKVVWIMGHICHSFELIFKIGCFDEIAIWIQKSNGQRRKSLLFFSIPKVITLWWWLKNLQFNFNVSALSRFYLILLDIWSPKITRIRLQTVHWCRTGSIESDNNICSCRETTTTSETSPNRFHVQIERDRMNDTGRSSVAQMHERDCVLVRTFFLVAIVSLAFEVLGSRARLWWMRWGEKCKTCWRNLRWAFKSIVALC